MSMANNSFACVPALILRRAHAERPPTRGHRIVRDVATHCALPLCVSIARLVRSNVQTRRLGLLPRCYVSVVHSGHA